MLLQIAWGFCVDAPKLIFHSFNQKHVAKKHFVTMESWNHKYILFQYMAYLDSSTFQTLTPHVDQRAQTRTSVKCRRRSEEWLLSKNSVTRTSIFTSHLNLQQKLVTSMWKFTMKNPSSSWFLSAFHHGYWGTSWLEWILKMAWKVGWNWPWDGFGFRNELNQHKF